MNAIRGALLALCALASSGCKRSSPPPPRQDPVPEFSPATPPNLLLHKAPIGGLLANEAALVLLVAKTWTVNPPEYSLEAWPHRDDAHVPIARTSPHARLIGLTAKEVVWHDWRLVNDVREDRLYVAPLVGGAPPRELDTARLAVDGPLILDRDRILGHGKLAEHDGVLGAVALDGRPYEILAYAPPSPQIRSRVDWLRWGCANNHHVNVPAVRVGEDFYYGAWFKAGDVRDLKAIEDTELTVAVCKLARDRTLTVELSRFGNGIVLLGADGGKLIAVTDGSVVTIEGNRETRRASLPKSEEVRKFMFVDGDLFVLLSGTIHRLRKDADRFETVLANASAFTIVKDRLFARMIDGVASVPLRP